MSVPGMSIAQKLMNARRSFDRKKYGAHARELQYPPMCSTVDALETDQRNFIF